MSEKASWKGMVSGRKWCQPLVEVTGLVRFAEVGRTGPFLATCSDGEFRYVKSIDNPMENPTTVINEFIVGSLAKVIQAPVCTIDLVSIPEDISIIRPDGVPVAPGVAVGSIDLGEAVLLQEMSFRHKDSNSERHARLLALSEWCAGTDLQWLAVGADMEFHGHDHGEFLTNSMWQGTANLVHGRSSTFVDSISTKDLDRRTLEALAQILRGNVREALAEVLNSVPKQWPVTDAELEDVGDFLEHRAQLAAAMLEGISP